RRSSHVRATVARGRLVPPERLGMLLVPPLPPLLSPRRRDSTGRSWRRGSCYLLKHELAGGRLTPLDAATREGEAPAEPDARLPGKARPPGGPGPRLGIARPAGARPRGANATPAAGSCLSRKPPRRPGQEGQWNDLRRDGPSPSGRGGR